MNLRLVVLAAAALVPATAEDKVASDVYLSDDPEAGCLPGFRCIMDTSHCSGDMTTPPACDGRSLYGDKTEGCYVIPSAASANGAPSGRKGPCGCEGCRTFWGTIGSIAAPFLPQSYPSVVSQCRCTPCAHGTSAYPCTYEPWHLNECKPGHFPSDECTACPKGMYSFPPEIPTCRYCDTRYTGIGIGLQWSLNAGAPTMLLFKDDPGFLKACGPYFKQAPAKMAAPADATPPRPFPQLSARAGSSGAVGSRAPTLAWAAALLLAAAAALAPPQ